MINFLKRLLGITELEKEVARQKEIIDDVAARQAILIINAHRKTIELTESMASKENVH